MKGIRLGLGLCLTLFASGARAGYFEISANGSYYKYTNGKTLGELNTETTKRVGAGIAYNFFGNVLIEFKYTRSQKLDKYTQLALTAGGTPDTIYRISRSTKFDNYGANLVLEFAPRKAQFRPYISGGIGYMERWESTSGTYEDAILKNGQTALKFSPIPSAKSISADAGIGFKLFIVERLALEGSFNVMATDLDKEEAFLHYSGSGGLRFLF
jgi:opacity protein-like surface antigen